MNLKDIIKKSFKISLELKLTGTRLLSIALLIFTWYFMKDIPSEAKAFFGISMSGVIVFLYTGKMYSEYKIEQNKAKNNG